MADEFVSIPVPVRHLAAIYGFIADLEKGGGKPPPTEQSPPSNGGAAPATNGVWTFEKLTWQYNDASDVIKHMQRYLADHPGVWCTTQDIAAAYREGYTAASMAGALGAAIRRLEGKTNRYKVGRRPWAFRWVAEKNTMEHMFDADTAAMIRKIVGR